MVLSRRSFLKHLAFTVAACGIGPAAVAKLLPPPVEGAKWVLIDVPQALSRNGIDGSSSFDVPEERLELKQIKVNALYRGEIGIYDGVTLRDRRLNR